MNSRKKHSFLNVAMAFCAMLPYVLVVCVLAVGFIIAVNLSPSEWLKSLAHGSVTLSAGIIGSSLMGILIAIRSTKLSDTLSLTQEMTDCSAMMVAFPCSLLFFLIGELERLLGHALGFETAHFTYIAYLVCYICGYALGRLIVNQKYFLITVLILLSLLGLCGQVFYEWYVGADSSKGLVTLLKESADRADNNYIHAGLLMLVECLQLLLNPIYGLFPEHAPLRAIKDGILITYPILSGCAGLLVIVFCHNDYRIKEKRVKENRL